MIGDGPVVRGEAAGAGALPGREYYGDGCGRVDQQAASLSLSLFLLFFDKSLAISHSFHFTTNNLSILYCLLQFLVLLFYSDVTLLTVPLGPHPFLFNSKKSLLLHADLSLFFFFYYYLNVNIERKG